MKKQWRKIETILIRSRLRLPIYSITIITGVGFFTFQSIFVPTYFVTFLGLLLIFESIHPNGYPLFYKYLTDFLPRKIQHPILFLLKSFGIILGVFLMIIGIGVEIGRLR